jgi:hypothetical protein
MTPDMLAHLDGLIGKPYELGAEGPDAFDCYGLARHILQAASGYNLPDADRGPDLVATIREHGERHRWQLVQSPEEWGLVLMGNVIQRTHHLGVWIFPDRRGAVIHAHPAMNVCIHDLASLNAQGFNDLRFYRRRLHA